MTVDEMPTRIEQNLQSKAVLDSVIDGSITSIESDVTIVRNSAFKECNKIVTVNFPHAIEIGEYAFSSYYTGVLTTAIFPSATRIKSCAFRYCTKLAVTNFFLLNGLTVMLLALALIFSAFISLIYNYWGLEHLLVVGL